MPPRCHPSPPARSPIRHRERLPCSSATETPCFSSGEEVALRHIGTVRARIWVMEVRTVTCAAAPTPEQAEALKAIMQAYNAACNFVSALAWEKHVFNQIALHHLTYRDIRAQFGLPSQVPVRAIAKVSDAYKTSKSTKAEFRPLGAITY